MCNLTSTNFLQQLYTSLSELTTARQIMVRLKTSSLDPTLEPILKNQLCAIEKYVWHEVKPYMDNNFYSSYCKQDSSDTTLINLAYLIFITLDHQVQIAKKQFDSMDEVLKELTLTPEIQELYLLLNDCLNFYDTSANFFKNAFLNFLVTL